MVPLATNGTIGKISNGAIGRIPNARSVKLLLAFSRYKFKAKGEVSSDSLLSKLGIQDLDVVLCTSRMRWFGHVECSTGWNAEIRNLTVVEQKRFGRPRDEVL